LADLPAGQAQLLNTITNIFKKVFFWSAIKKNSELLPTEVTMCFVLQQDPLKLVPEAFVRILYSL